MIYSDSGKIKDGIFIVDAFGWSSDKTTSSYIIKGNEVAIFDPAGSKSADRILQYLDYFNIEYDKVKFIFISHRHNDHSAGASVLVHKLKNAKIYAHKITNENLKNPTKINMATENMYGYLAEPIEPVDESFLVNINDNDIFDLGEGLKIKALHMPGHTSDHFMFQEEKNNFIFTGDGAGLFSFKHKIVIPNSFPPSFKYEEYKKSLQRLIDLKPRIIGFSHFGAVESPDELLTESIEILEDWKKIISENDNYMDLLIKKYGPKFELFDKNFRKEVLNIIISGFKSGI